MRAGVVAVICGALLAGCTGGGSADSADVDRACELLTTERDLPIPPPGMGTVSRSLATYVTELFAEDESNATVSVDAAGVNALGPIAREVESLDGIEVIEVLDQDATYQAFVELFPDSPQLTSVDALMLPASIRVHAETDADLDDLVAWADGQARVGEVNDAREVASSTLRQIARQFGVELAELEDVMEGDAKAAVHTIRAIKDVKLAQLDTTVSALTSFIEDHCVAAEPTLEEETPTPTVATITAGLLDAPRFIEGFDDAVRSEVWRE